MKKAKGKISSKELGRKIEQFAYRCRQAGLKVTPQRIAVYRELLTTQEHPSAEILHRKLRKKFPSISLDTVNRTLLTLNEIGAAHVVEATVEPSQSGFRVTATVASADIGWDRYADTWEVRDESGEVIGTRVLAHPHVDEQPFTRSLDGVDIPSTVSFVEIAARDSVSGFCGSTVLVQVPHGE